MCARAALFVAGVRQLARPHDRVLALAADEEVLVQQPRTPEAVLQVRRREAHIVARGEREAAHDALGQQPLAERANRSCGGELLGGRSRRLQELEERVAEALLRLGRGVELEAA